jgi:hypothetical protein
MLIDTRRRVNVVSCFLEYAPLFHDSPVESSRRGASADGRATLREARAAGVGDPGYNCSLITDHNYPRFAAWGEDAELGEALV